MKIKHIYWFAAYNLNGPSARYRGYFPLEYMRKNENIQYDFVYPERTVKGVYKFVKVYLTALLFRKKNSIIVVQKICSNGLYANMLKLLVVLRTNNTQYDLDDAEYLRQDTKTLHYFLRKCSIISVGSDALKKYCNKFNKNVFMLTSPVIYHENIKQTKNKILNIGWVGDFGNGNKISQEFSHKKSMYEILFPVLKSINKPLSLTLIGIKNQKDIPEIHKYFQDADQISINILKDLDWENDKDWVYEEISKFDIGISPMTNHLYNRSKSAFKSKQYLSVGVPAIASDVGENSKYVLNGINGILFNYSEELKKAIERFIEMSDIEYALFSKNALKYRNDYSIKKYYETIAEHY